MGHNYSLRRPLTSVDDRNAQPVASLAISMGLPDSDLVIKSTMHRTLDPNLDWHPITLHRREVWPIRASEFYARPTGSCGGSGRTSTGMPIPNRWTRSMLLFDDQSEVLLAHPATLTRALSGRGTTALLYPAVPRLEPTSRF